MSLCLFVLHRQCPSSLNLAVYSRHKTVLAPHSPTQTATRHLCISPRSRASHDLSHQSLRTFAQAALLQVAGQTKRAQGTHGAATYSCCETHPPRNILAWQDAFPETRTDARANTTLAQSGTDSFALHRAAAACYDTPRAHSP